MMVGEREVSGRRQETGMIRHGSRLIALYKSTLKINQSVKIIGKACALLI
jgi:hypothetical protein